MAEGIGFALAVALIAIVITVYAARRAVLRRPQASASSQVFRALFAFPGAALLLFALATLWTLFGATDPGEPGTTGMVVFAFFFFLFYALVIGGIVSIPAAILAVRNARNQ